MSSIELESTDKRISQVRGSKGHRTSGQVVSSITRTATSTRAAMAYLKANLAKANNESVTPFSPIGCSLMNMDTTVSHGWQAGPWICHFLLRPVIMTGKH